MSNNRVAMVAGLPWKSNDNLGVLTIAPPDGSTPIGGINARFILCPTGGINTWLVSEVTPMLRLANQYTYIQ
jgi:hypothetical protein